MPRFHCVVLSEQSYDSLTGQADTASIERPVATDHLQNTVSLSNERRGKYDKRFILLISFNTW
jgi:hypothetical protein